MTELETVAFNGGRESSSIDAQIPSDELELSDNQAPESMPMLEQDALDTNDSTEAEAGSIDAESLPTVAGSGDTSADRLGSSAGSGGGGGGEHIVMVHVGAGETFCVRVGDQVQHVRGPATVRMVSTNGPPMPMQMQVPPGHLVQQIVDENGILTHVILAPQMGAGPYYFPGLLPSNLMLSSPMAMTPVGGYAADADGQQQQQQQQQTNTTAEGSNGSDEWYQPAYRHCKRPLPAIGGRLQHARKSPDRQQQQQQQYYAPRRKRFAASQDWSNNGYRQHQQQQQQHYHQQHYYQSYDPNQKHLLRNSHGPPPIRGNGYQHYHQHYQHNQLSHHQDRFRRRNLSSSEERSRGGAAPANAAVADGASDTAESCAISNDKNNSSTITGGSAANTMIIDSIEQNRPEPTLETPQPPIISDIETTSVVIQVCPPADLTDEDLLAAAYELHLSDKSARGPYSLVFDGQAEEICLRDLKPGQRYWARSLTKLPAKDGASSDFSPAAHFLTQSAPPSAPASPPELIGRPGPSWLALRWPPAARDNGAPVTAYVLQAATADRSFAEYRELYRGPLLHHRCDGLSPCTTYWFRVAAINALGQSDYSPSVAIATSDTNLSTQSGSGSHAGPCDQRPRPPRRLRLRNNAGAGRYVLVWSPPETFDDDGSCQLREYLIEAGPSLSCTVPAEQRELDAANWLPAGRRHSVTVRARSDAGLSEPSEPLTVIIPAPPGPPGQPRLRGPPRNGELRLAWSEPTYDGGAAVTGYEARARLEGTNDDSNASAPATTVASSTLHCSVAKLLPGAVYIVTVRAANAAGFGPWSSRLRAVCGPPLPPAPTAPTVSICDVDVNRLVEQSILDSELPTMGMADGEVAAELLLPRLSAVISWEAPKPAAATQQQQQQQAGSALPNPAVLASSSAVMEYRLEARMETTDIQDLAREEQAPGEYRLIYTGELLSHKVSDLLAATTYSFRVQAVNISGGGEFSLATVVTTPAAPPGPVESLIQTGAEVTSVTVAWQPPKSNNGAPISGYEIFLGDNVASNSEPTIRVLADQTEATLTGLLADSRYDIRVRAVNSAGAGLFCRPGLRASTLCQPPARIECTPCGGGSTAVRIRWTPAATAGGAAGSGESAISYQVEMSSFISDNDSVSAWQQVYLGTGLCTRIGRLAELTNYRIRIRAVNSAGAGPYSQAAQFVTGRAPPPAPRPPRVSDVSQVACRVEWSMSAAAAAAAAVNQPQQQQSAPMQFVLQMMQVGDCGNEYRQVYKGPDTGCNLGCLRPGAEYRLRVAAIRRCPDTQEELISSFSHSTVFLAKPATSGGGASSNSSFSRRAAASSAAPLSEALCSANRVAWSERRVAAAILAAFALLAVAASMLLRRLVTYD